MSEVDPSVGDLYSRLDRFLQWDLVTVTPWGAPSISPVGARLIPEEATVWTSTTVGYAAKVRNIQAHPRVALMRVHPEEPPVLVRGEARVVGGDGTLNLAQLFRLMGGAGGARRFFATSVTDPFWSQLYRSYWHRFLIAVRIVEISTIGPHGWEPIKVASWSRSKIAASPPSRPRRPARHGGLVDSKGRAMLSAGTPVALATVRREGSAPLVWPVRATPEVGGDIRVDAGVPLPPERLPHTSLAVRVLDDTFEVAQMAGWIGELEPGRSSRLLRPRASYGFTKPPGVVGDLAAGVAALVRVAGLKHPLLVSPPDVARAVELGGVTTSALLELPEPGWRLLEEIFARRNAAAPWYAGMATVVSDRRLQRSLTILSERAQLERDWALGLLARGSRRVGAARLASGALALRPNPAAPAAVAAREEAQIDRLLTRLVGYLPPGVAGPPERVEGDSQTRSAPAVKRGRDQGVADVTMAAAGALAAAVDRWKERRPG
ncbi:MAG TPA: pyridoxamine 5'-phosphate oxidase family protein [Candidatus Dormibacteraeota bacterium]|nr:pyridoxamine 5'-phosphate oxidase family protein [Candidatus Dormibacteraeota bacterium]